MYWPYTCRCTSLHVGNYSVCTQPRRDKDTHMAIFAEHKQQRAPEGVADHLSHSPRQSLVLVGLHGGVHDKAVLQRQSTKLTVQLDPAHQSRVEQQKHTATVRAQRTDHINHISCGYEELSNALCVPILQPAVPTMCTRR